MTHDKPKGREGVGSGEWEERGGEGQNTSIMPGFLTEA